MSEELDLFDQESNGKYLIGTVNAVYFEASDSFYKVLPVTLDFAKILSRVAKQDVVIYDKPYDFRYFM